MKDKRGLIGKIFLLIGIILLILIGVIAFTAYQAFSFFSFLQSEIPLIESDAKEIGTGDCSKIDSIELRISNINSKAESRCKNPLIRIALDKIEQIPFNCNNLEEGYSLFLGEFDNVRKACELRENL